MYACVMLCVRECVCVCVCAPILGKYNVVCVQLYTCTMYDVLVGGGVCVCNICTYSIILAVETDIVILAISSN